LRALLQKETWRSVRDFTEDALTETTTRLLLEQIAGLHERIPGRDLVPEDLCDAVQQSYGGDLQKDALAYVETLREARPADDSVVRSLLARQLLDRANDSILQSRLAGKLDIATPESLVQRAREVFEGGSAVGALALDEFGLPSEGKDRGRVLTLGTSKLDAVFGGGHGEGEMVVVAAPPKRGKTSMMISIGEKQVEAGHNVLHIGMEVKGAKNARLYERAAVHKRKADWTDADTVLAREIIGRNGGRLWIKDLSHTRTTPGQIEAIIRAVERENSCKIDCVVLDYLQLLSLPGFRPDQSRFAYSEIARQVRAIASRLSTRVLTGWQINREGAKQDTADEFGLSECWDIFMHLDGLIILNQSRAEKANHTMRLTIAAQREDPDAARTVLAYVDWGTMTVQDHVKGAANAVHQPGGEGAGVRPIVGAERPEQTAAGERIGATSVPAHGTDPSVPVAEGGAEV
jgi:KaiC/GvpD/RAD55 family RecA-like ATPase